MIQSLSQLFKTHPERFLVIVLLVIIGGFTLSTFVWHPATPITTFADCKQSSGSHILETYPEQCLTAQGKAFIQALPTGPQATLHGTITITPSCTLPTPQPTLSSGCQFEPQLYTAYDIVAYRVDQQTIVGQAPINEQGDYQLKLPAGQYLIDLLPSSKDKPTSITLNSGQDLSLNLQRTVTVK